MNISFNSNMPGIKARRQSFGIGTLLFLLLFGAGFTAAGVFAIKSGKIDPNWTRVNGRVGSSSSNISNGSTTYAAVVTYEVKGQSYQVTSGTSSSVYPHIGDSRQVAYDPSQPNEAKIVGSVGTQGFLYIFPVVGIACLVLAPFAFIRSLRRSSDINHLIQNGQKLQGILVNIQSIGVNNTNSSYRIEVSATDYTGRVQNYVSDTLGGIGGLAIADFTNTPIPIDVYVNPANPKDYYVDVSGIPSLTPERIADLIKSVRSGQNNTFAQAERPNLSSQQIPPQDSAR